MATAVRRTSVRHQCCFYL